MEKLDCLFIGSVTKDIMMHLTDAPLRDQRVLADNVCITGGGIAGTSSSAFSKLGGKGGIISAIGDDDAGEFACGFVNSMGLAYTQLITMPGKLTPFSAILVEPDGKRLISYYGGCIDYLTIDMIDKEALASTEMVHLGGMGDYFIIDLAKYIREHTNAVISVDGGNRSKECIDALLPYTDIFIPDNKTVARTIALPDKEACVYCHEKGAGTVCITLGENGSIAYKDGKFYSAPPIKSNVYDTTGAGDNFHGAFVYCTLNGYDMDYTLKFCNTYSGLCCEALGGPSSEPTLEETVLRMKAEYENGAKHEDISY